MAATLKDVAEHARVSVRTVSNVIAGYHYVSDQMRARVQRAIDELDYRPNPVARTLRTGKTGVLALVVPEIDSPYFGELATCVIDSAAAIGYRVFIDQTGHDRDQERQVLNGSDRTMLVDGILFSPLVTATELEEMRSRLATPLMLLGEHTFDGTYDHVAIDNVQAAHDATKHLLDLGRTRIAAIGEQPAEDFATPQQRSLGYQRALRETGLDPLPTQTRPANHYRRGDGYRAAQELLTGDERPDAIFCFSDLLAIGAMKAVFDAGLRVPDDIAVIGIDDIEEGRYTRPTLSSVSLDVQRISDLAVQRLAERIEDPDLEVRDEVVPHHLVARESTGRMFDAASPIKR